MFNLLFDIHKSLGPFKQGKNLVTVIEMDSHCSNIDWVVVVEGVVSNMRSKDLEKENQVRNSLKVCVMVDFLAELLQCNRVQEVLTLETAPLFMKDWVAPSEVCQ